GAGGVMTAAVGLALAALAFARRSTAWRTRGTRLAAVALVALVALTAWGRDPLHGPFYLPNAKLFPRIPRAFIASRSCDSTACVDLFLNPWHHGLWGISPAWRAPVPTQVGVVIDAWAITSIFEAGRRPDGGPELRHPIFEMLLASFSHLVDRARDFHPQRMLVIGAGGGVDVRAALHFGVPRIEGVELNRNIIAAVAGPFDAFAGGIYHHPAVHIAHAEGRHYLRRSPHRYDLIQLSGVDTYAASQAGAFALSENFLYTTEAFKEYLDHLTPDGTLTLTRWLYHPPRHTLRLCAIAVDAYRELGLGDAAERMVILSTNIPGSPLDLSLVLARRRPFRPDELRAIRALAAARGFLVIWSPDSTTRANEFERYFRAPDRAAFVRDYHYRIDPSTDDSPFFFEYNRFSRLRSSREFLFGAASGQTLLVVTFALSLVGGALLLFGLPWLVRRRRPEPAPMGPAWTVYFLALGLGYIAVETVFIPRFALFLGNPVYALSVVLFSLLLSSGVGAAFAPALTRQQPRRLAALALAVAAVLVLYRFGLQALFVAGLGLPLAARVAVAAALIALPGSLMGVAFPTGLTLGSAQHPEAQGSWVARAWVLNGYASVVGSVGAMIAAMAGGFSTVLLLAALCYVIAAATAWRARA
ncbi:MAG: putative Spermidine synthase, partial [Myxococcaceae bacterium]|nr:putative Spermidine synthase [Myxococcaceae bacterium]